MTQTMGQYQTDKIRTERVRRWYDDQGRTIVLDFDVRGGGWHGVYIDVDFVFPAAPVAAAISIVVVIGHGRY